MNILREEASGKKTLPKGKAAQKAERRFPPPLILTDS
jgi:hypothetical protein